MASAQNNHGAMVHLGHLYEHGLGVDQDKSKALDLYLATAQKENADNLYYIGVEWEIESTQPNDMVMAYLWYRMAAHKGNNQGNTNCSYLAKSMTSEQISKAKEISRVLIKRYDDVQMKENLSR
jgi:hypothetical protein